MKTGVRITIILIFLVLVLCAIASQATASTKHDVGIYVTDQNHNPLENSYVTINDEGKLTNSKGACAFSLEPGQYDVEIEHSDYETLHKDIEVSQPTTYACNMEPEKEDELPWTYWVPLIAIIIFGLLFAIGLLIMLGRKGGRKRRKTKGGTSALIIITIIILAMLSNCGCIEEVQKKGEGFDSSPLYCGEGKWFFTTLDFEIYVKSYNSKTGKPELPTPQPTNEATQQLYSDYTIRITPIEPDNYRGNSDGNDDGIPDGIQTTEDYAFGIDGILQSIPEACNGQGYNGKLYNGIVNDPKKLDFADDILPQTHRSAGVRASTDDDRGIIEDLFLGTMDRPFVRMMYNFQDDFLEEAIYITIPLTIHVTANGRITGREIFSTDLVVPFFVHIPPPGQDREIVDHLSLDLFTPLTFLGGGIVTVEAQGSEVSGYAWMNVKTQASILKDVFNDWKKAVEQFELAMKLMVVGAVVGLLCPLLGLVLFVIAAWLLWDTYDDATDIGNLIFIPGIGWEFSKGMLKGLQEWLYKINPGVTGPSGGSSNV